MRDITEILKRPELLSEILKENAARHNNYKMYTSMERALGILASGYIYLSMGKKWNDVSDRNVMEQNRAFGTCFSCSTRENVAMWMLYGKNYGKDAVLLNFTRAMLKEICDISTIELGKFNKSGEFEKNFDLSVDQNDARIFLTDIVYEDHLSSKGESDTILTYNEKHVTVEKDVLNKEDIFHKNYAWSYEKRMSISCFTI